MNVTTITPSKATYKQAMAANAVIALPLVFIGVFGTRNNPLVMLVIILGTVALCLLGVWLFFRNTRIQFGDGRISRRNILGIERSWAINEIGHVLLVERLIAPRQAATWTLVLLDAVGGKILRITSTVWQHEHVDALFAEIPLKPEVISEPTTAKVLRTRYPGAFAWWEAHPWAFAWIVVIGVLALVVAAVLVFM